MYWLVHRGRNKTFYGISYFVNIKNFSYNNELALKISYFSNYDI